LLYYNISKLSTSASALSTPKIHDSVEVLAMVPEGRQRVQCLLCWCCHCSSSCRMCDTNTPFISIDGPTCPCESRFAHGGAEAIDATLDCTRWPLIICHQHTLTCPSLAPETTAFIRSAQGKMIVGQCSPSHSQYCRRVPSRLVAPPRRKRSPAASTTTRNSL
jgi:hypothetical protein